MPFGFADSPVAIRSDLGEAFSRTWHALASAGSWWNGAERVAIAAEVRGAHDCVLCGARKAALSPEMVQGEHDSTRAADLLPGAAIEAVHRITRDPARLSKAWFDRVTAEIGAERYVELLGIVVALVSVDGFHRALGLTLEPLPEALPGEPDGYRPANLREGGAWLPMLPNRPPSGRESDLWGLGTGNVIRAMSLVPDAVRRLQDLSGAMYLDLEDIPNPAASGRRAIDRAQIELLAGRVSALHECFY